MEIQGTVTKKGEAEPFVQVFPSTLEGKPLDTKIGATTDYDGVFKLKIPSELNAKYINARTVQGNSVQKLNSSVTDYEINLDFVQSQELETVTVTAKSNATLCKEAGGNYDATNKKCNMPPRFKKPKINWKKRLLVGGIVLVVLGTAGYFIVKKVRG